MEGIKRFFECIVPVSVCNLECSYCYVIQNHYRDMQLAHMQYSPEHIVKALRRERVGGVCMISICGAGETLVQPEIPEIVALLLKEGHYVNITTNGTLTNKFKEIIERCGEDIERLHVSFSFHYVELKQRNLINIFFENIKLMRKAGASFLLQFNLCDEYLPYLGEMKEIALREVGALPQVALTRDESCVPTKIMTTLSEEEYLEIGKQFDSPLFDFTCKNFNVKRKEFCYAGDWSGLLDLSTGIFRKCYYNNEYKQNIFEDIDKPIKFEAVGRNCKHLYCFNSSHFMSLGVIPEIETPSYGALRNRPDANWYSKTMEDFLNSKLKDSNKQYSPLKKYLASNKEYTLKEKLVKIKFINKLYRKIKKK